jgi:hypothetical protein
LFIALFLSTPKLPSKQGEMSFAFNPDAKVFVPQKIQDVKDQSALQGRIRELEQLLSKERISNTKLQTSSPEKTALQLKIREKDKTIEELNRSIRRVTTDILSIRCECREARQRQEELEIENQKQVEQLVNKNNEIRKLKDTIEYRVADIQRERNLLNDARSDVEKWMGRCLRLDYIFKQLRKISALPEDHGEWVYDMVDSIEFPDNPRVSIYDSIPLFIREENLPHYGDAHMEPVDRDEENYLIQRLSIEAHEYSVSIDESLLECDDLMEQNGNQQLCAIKIQAAWRGYKSRVIITYDGHISENSVRVANMVLDKDSIRGSYNPRYRIFTSDMNCHGLYFFNSSDEPISYQWIVPNSRTGRIYTIESRKFIKIATYYGHWFRVWPEYKENSCYFFRITPNSRFPTQGYINLSDRVYFDLNTRITTDYDTYCSSIHKSRPLSIKFYKSMNTNDESDDELQMAIQLSLEDVDNSLTNDVEDYNIAQMFESS